MPRGCAEEAGAVLTPGAITTTKGNADSQVGIFSLSVAQIFH
jgi:hypothetical protein